MTDLNHVVVIGRLTKGLDDSNFGYLQSGTARANISLAVNRSRKDGDQWVDDVSYFTVTIFGKMAENCLEKCEIGRGLRVVGRLKQNRWKNNDGKSHSKISIIAEHIEFKKMLTHTENEKDAKETIAEPNTREEKEMQAANIAACTQEISLEEKVEVPVEAVVF